jgi:hypothetical protein
VTESGRGERGSGPVWQPRWAGPGQAGRGRREGTVEGGRNSRKRGERGQACPEPGRGRTGTSEGGLGREVGGPGSSGIGGGGRSAWNLLGEGRGIPGPAGPGVGCLRASWDACGNGAWDWRQSRREGRRTEGTGDSQEGQENGRVRRRTEGTAGGSAAGSPDRFRARGQAWRGLPDGVRRPVTGRTGSSGGKG